MEDNNDDYDENYLSWLENIDLNKQFSLWTPFYPRFL